jgi:hypothetical protein
MMDKGKRLKISACNVKEARGVVRQANANFVELYDQLAKLRDDFDALITRLESAGARPT